MKVKQNGTAAVSTGKNDVFIGGGGAGGGEDLGRGLIYSYK